jgi:hypothetical protein
MNQPLHLPKTARLQCRLHKGSKTLSDSIVPWQGNADWEIHEETPPDTGKFPGKELLITLRRAGDALDNASVALTFDMEDWSRDHYVFMPPTPATALNRAKSPTRPFSMHARSWPWIQIRSSPMCRDSTTPAARAT